MRRVVVILRKFREWSGHEQPHVQTAIRNDTGLLQAMGLPKEEIRRRVKEATGL